MSFVIEPTILKDAYVLTPKIFEDNRGYFFESYSKKDISSIFNGEFIQDNQSFSSVQGVIRGLHCQTGLSCQTKLVRVIQGAVDDVIVDVRRGSPSYLQWVRVRLSGDNHRMLFIPKGFLHGFVTVTDNVIFAYQVDEYYDKNSERAVFYKDPKFGIDWGTPNPVLSEKDLKNPLFDNSGIGFVYQENL